jgi:cysteinyl-tRNA synthetase
MALKLFNTLSKKVEEFIPLNPPKVGMYTCGPTVYDYSHIGHMRKYVGDDLLRRVLELDGFEVQHVENVTDVGHLTGEDDDTGDDKLEKGAKERNESVWEVARFFEKFHFQSLDKLNCYPPNIICRATEHISEQIKLIQKLEEKGYTYQTEEAVYFDTSKFPNYGKLAGQKLEEKEEGVRENVVTDPKKKHPQDFAVWFFTVGKFKDHVMKWDSPWGEGFPGWHIECSAMSMEYLGNTLDIHTGGQEHKFVHHPNEIAQSEAATGEQFVRFWVHHGWLMVDGTKMSKSLKNFYTVDDVEAKGFDPLALRYLFLTAHYRDQLNFTWESLQAAQNALNNLKETVRDWDEGGELDQKFWGLFIEAVNNDLNVPIALAVMWNMVKSDLPSNDKSATILEMDKVLGLKLADFVGKKVEVPENVQKLVDQREKAREEKDFAQSDKIRKEIKDLGFEVEDTPEGPKLKPL